MKTYAVLLETLDGVDTGKVTRLLAEIKRVPFFEASRKKAGLTGIVAENLDERSAHELVLRLKNNGMRSFTVETEKMVALPQPVEIQRGNIANELLSLEGGDAIRGIKRWDIRWDSILFLTCARVKAEEIIKRMDVEQKVVGTPAGHMYMKTVPVTKRVARAKWVNLLDIFSSEPYGLFRITAESFNFSSLGLRKLMPSHYQNLVQFIRVLVRNTPDTFVDASVRFILDGNPLTNLRTPGINSYETHVRWVLQLALAGRHR